jgi:hypothetical protein
MFTEVPPLSKKQKGILHFHVLNLRRQTSQLLQHGDHHSCKGTTTDNFEGSKRTEVPSHTLIKSKLNQHEERLEHFELQVRFPFAHS